MTIQDGNNQRAHPSIAEELFGGVRYLSIQIIRFFLPVVLAIGITWLFFSCAWPYLSETPPVSDQESVGDWAPSIVVFRWLERLPTTQMLYYCIAALAGAYLGCRWCSYANCSMRFAAGRRKEGKDRLTSRDWRVAQELRERAFVLRTRAVCILGGIFLLLLMGVYFAIFILPRVESSDEIIISEIRQHQYKREISIILDSLFRGHYWIGIEASNIPVDVQTAIDESRGKMRKTKGYSRMFLNLSRWWRLKAMTGIQH